MKFLSTLVIAAISLAVVSAAPGVPCVTQCESTYRRCALACPSRDHLCNQKCYRAEMVCKRNCPH
ncbi:hypothetical protein K7432_003234 [Basidiobolus ranarum]|uniref:Uncharacterized protein n=1 Tax=Basidiobolus ranarum TaxID=34480 RepID=A0ABR2W6H7_9FUNG